MRYHYKAVLKKLEQLSQQINFFKPDYIVPFASHIFFSNKDNFYLNDRVAKIENVTEYIEKKYQNVKPIILYPGEKWNFSAKNNSISLKKYIDSRNNIKILFIDKTVFLEDIITESKIYKKRIYSKNNKILIYIIKFLSSLLKKDFFPDVSFYLYDLNKTVKFSLTSNIQVIDKKISNIDIQLSSHSFFYLLKYEWGLSTLIINGKFISCSQNGELKIKKLFALSLINSTGKNLLDYIVKRIFKLKHHKIADYDTSFLNSRNL